jgi:carboxyl-terminal processing protease
MVGSSARQDRATGACAGGAPCEQRGLRCAPVQGEGAAIDRLEALAPAHRRRRRARSSGRRRTSPLAAGFGDAGALPLLPVIYRVLLGLCLLLAACSGKSSPTAARVKPDEPTSASPALPADAREPVLSQAIRQLLETQHMRHRQVDDEVSRQAFAEYLERLDAGKMFLLEAHVAELRSHATRMDDELRGGDLLLARSGAALLRERLKVVARLVAAQLARPFDFSRAEEVETDADKLNFARSEEELADRWRRMLKLQVLERIARMEEGADALAAAEADDVTDALAPPAGPARAADAGVAPAGDRPTTFAGREQKAREDLAKSYAGRFTRLGKVDPLEAAESFLNAVATVYDPHTVYLAPAAKENFDIAMSGSLEGIGAVLSEDDHYIVVRELVPGGASWRQGRLEAGDLIMAVAQAGAEPVDVADMPIDQVVQMIRGPRGTVVRLTVKKPDGRIHNIAIQRDVVQIEAAYASGAILAPGGKAGPTGASDAGAGAHNAGAHNAAHKVGYIRLPSFYGNTRGEAGATPERNATDDVRKLLQRFQSARVGAVILDLRGNGGGLLDQARDIAGMFIETGPVVQTRHADGESQVLEDTDPSVIFSGEVLVLVDRFSASAAEIVAGALQDYRRAIVVGTGPTHGKGTVQMLVDLDRLRDGSGPPLGVLKLTIQQFFRVSGDSTQWRGVVPDVLLPDPVAHVEAGERALDHSIPWSEVQPLTFTPWARARWNKDVLAARSKARRDKNAVFAKIDARSAYLKQRQEQTRVPLAQVAWTAERQRHQKALEAVDPQLAKSPARFQVTPLDSDADKAADKRTREAAGRANQALARDPWIEEALRIAADMASGPAVASQPHGPR